MKLFSCNVNFEKVFHRTEDIFDTVGKYNTPITPLGTATAAIRITVATTALVISTIARTILWAGCARASWRSKARRTQAWSLRQIKIGLIEIVPLGIKWIAEDVFGYDLGSRPKQPQQQEEPPQDPPPAQDPPAAQGRPPQDPPAAQDRPPAQDHPQAHQDRPSSRALVPLRRNAIVRPGGKDRVKVTIPADVARRFFGDHKQLALGVPSRDDKPVELLINPKDLLPSHALFLRNLLKQSFYGPGDRDAGGAGDALLQLCGRRPLPAMAPGEDALCSLRRPFCGDWDAGGAGAGGAGGADGDDEALQNAIAQSSWEFVSLGEGPRKNTHASRVWGAAGTGLSMLGDFFRNQFYGNTELDELAVNKGISKENWLQFKWENTMSYSTLKTLVCQRGSMLGLQNYIPMMYFLIENPVTRPYGEAVDKIFCARPMSQLSNDTRPSTFLTDQRNRTPEKSVLIYPMIIPGHGLFSSAHIVMCAVNYERGEMVFFDSKGTDSYNNTPLFENGKTLKDDIEGFAAKNKLTLHIAPSKPSQVSDSHNCGMHVFNAIRCIYQRMHTESVEGPFHDFITDESLLLRDIYKLRREVGVELLSVLVPAINNGCLEWEQYSRNGIARLERDRKAELPRAASG